MPCVAALDAHSDLRVQMLCDMMDWLGMLGFGLAGTAMIPLLRPDFLLSKCDQMISRLPLWFELMHRNPVWPELEDRDWNHLRTTC